jgi:hypothetical protein
MVTSIKKFIGSMGLTGDVSFGADLVGRGPFATDVLSVRRTSEFRSSKAGHVNIPVEPRPDLLSGDGSGRPDDDGHQLVIEPMCLGKTLHLQFTMDPLFNRDKAAGASMIVEAEHLMIRQGAVKNCPLAACLVALARSPGWRPLLLGMVSEIPEFISSCRHPAKHEWCRESEKPRFECFSSDHHFVVTFRRKIELSGFLLNRPKWLNKIAVKGPQVIVTGTLYQHTGHQPPLLHYVHLANELGISKGQPIWPAIIEKAYAVAKGNHYESLNHGLDSVDVLRDIAGPATRIRLNRLDEAALTAKLSDFIRRPVVLDTRDDLPELAIPPRDHAVAVVEFGKDLKGRRKVSVFDAANAVQVDFLVRDLESTFSDIAQVTHPR